MTVSQQLFALQWQQRTHDQRYHQDVLILPLGERLKHMALHNAKYAGRLLEAIDTNDSALMVRLLTDAFIITLATANTLNDNLGSALGVAGEIEDDERTAGLMLATTLGRVEHDPLWFIKSYIKHNGGFAKACESLDHLDPVPYRQQMVDSNRALLQLLLAETAARSLALFDQYQTRLSQVERRSIFHGLHEREPGDSNGVLGNGRS